MPKTVSSTELQKNVRGMIDWARTRGEAVVIATYGQPMAALLPYDEFLAYERYRRARTARLARLREAASTYETDADLARAAARAQVAPEEDAAVDREMQAYIALHPALKEAHYGRHVAIHGGELVDVDDDFAALYRRIDARYPHQYVWLARVEDEPLPTRWLR